MKRNKIRVCVFVTKKSRNVSSKKTIDESRLGIWKVRNMSQHHSACLLEWLFFNTLHIALTMLSVLLLLLIFARRPWSTLSLDKACTHPSNSEQQKHSLILCKYWQFAHWDLTLENKLHAEQGGRVGLVVRALAFHQCGPGSISALGVICGLSLLVLYSAMRGFPPGAPVFPSHQKPTFDLIWFDLIWRAIMKTTGWPVINVFTLVK